MPEEPFFKQLLIVNMKFLCLITFSGGFIYVKTVKSTIDADYIFYSFCINKTFIEVL